MSDPPSLLTLLVAQRRILKALRSDAVLRGTPEGLSRRLRVSSEAFGLALRDLAAESWIFVTFGSEDELLVSRERRLRDVGPPQIPERRSPSSLLPLLIAQGRILKALAGDVILQGTAEDLSHSLGVSSEAFGSALDDLIAGSWIFVMSGPEGELLVGGERRVRDAGPPELPERRAR